MALDAFVPEIWDAAILSALQKALIYAGPGVVNHDYEGDVAEAGDTVRITSIGRPTVATYTPDNPSITPESIIAANRTLVIDQVKYWAFKVDDINKRQALGDVMTRAAQEAAYALADVQDQYVAGLYTQAQSANVVPEITIDISSPTSWDAEAAKAYNEILIPLKVKLDEANVPTVGRYAVLPPWLHGVLLRDSRFVKVNESGTEQGLRNGQVGRAAGFNILMSNNCPLPSANHNIVTAGTDAAITFVTQLSKTEAYRPEAAFADALKGLSLYGAKVIRPDSLAYQSVVWS